jgi:hypothetical protein
MDILNDLKNENNKLLISSIVLSIFFCFLHFNLYQQSLDTALIISGKVKYPEDFSIMKYYYLKSFSIVNYISAALLILTDSLRSGLDRRRPQILAHPSDIAMIRMT